MRKKDETLQRRILDLARNMANTTGPDSITIRRIAKKAGVATGTIYNYFSSKEDILLALTEEYWYKTLMGMDEAITSETFYRQLEEIYEFLSRQIHQSAGMLMGSLTNVETAGRARMQSMQQKLGEMLIQRMEEDDTICEDIWNGHFTKEQYVSFIIMNMMLLLEKRAPNMDFFIEVVKRTIY
ncbi:TetR/AcrR family transcriptional regulator [Dethiothermospora halolimnae]|uniref:TetR/AcrR family transcriptional regulator n=1 Tax=Dethiothermospora halolimnae TaxID=3114390 RepID=UPI003CCB8066